MHQVLHVDDDGDVRQLVKLALEELGGMKVHQCRSGEQALKIAEALNPDVVLLDMMMPGMNGEETLIQLRLLPTLRETPVIFMTAKSNRESQDTVIRLGASGVIQKPFDPITLAQEVRAVCGWG